MLDVACKGVVEALYNVVLLFSFELCFKKFVERLCDLYSTSCLVYLLFSFELCCLVQPLQDDLEVFDLLFSFELCVEKQINTSETRCRVPLAIFFWIMLEYNTTGGWSSKGILLFSFELCAQDKQKAIQLASEAANLLFSFELCLAGRGVVKNDSLTS